jgi:hypothetical protein
MNIIIFLAIFIVFAISVTAWVSFLKNKGRSKIKNFNKQEETDKVRQYIDDFSHDNRDFFQKLIGTSEIDAYAYVTAKYSKTDDSSPENRLSAISNIKLGTSQHYDIALLSGSRLYIIDMELNKFIVLPPSTMLEEYSAEQMKLSSEVVEANKTNRQLPYELKAYKATFVADDDIIEIQFYNSKRVYLSPSENYLDDFLELLKDKSELNLLDYAVGNYFIKQLCKTYPKIQIETSFD